MAYKMLLTTIPLGDLIKFANEVKDCKLYTVFPILEILSVSDPDKKGNVTISTRNGSIRTNLYQCGHFIRVPDDVAIAIMSVSAKQYQDRIKSYNEGQGLTWQK